MSHYTKTETHESNTPRTYSAAAIGFDRLMQEAEQMETELAAAVRNRDEARAELAKAEDCITATRFGTMLSMDEIRQALGAPSGFEDKSQKRAIDYVSEAAAELAKLRAERDKANVNDDTRRLDWLERNGNIDKTHCDAMSGPPFFYVDNYESQAGLRAAIDAAGGLAHLTLDHNHR